MWSGSHHVLKATNASTIAQQISYLKEREFDKVKIKRKTWQISNFYQRESLDSFVKKIITPNSEL